jgi:AraC family ethanolamine operon transcriptional activator
MTHGDSCTRSDHPRFTANDGIDGTRSGDRAHISLFRVHTRIADDADEQARQLIGWKQTYDQLTPGSFTGSLTDLRLDWMQVFCETTSHALRQSCEVPKGAIWFGIPLRTDGGVGRIGGLPIGDDALAVMPGGEEFELVTPARFDILGVVVDGDVLRRYAAEVEQLGLSDDLLSREAVPVGAARKERLCAAVSQILGDAARSAVPLSIVSRNALQSSVLASLFDLCVAPHDAAPARKEPYRQWIVRQARDYVLAHRDRPVAVSELCAQLHVSRRTLQYCFQDVLGMTPIAYLRAIRLNGVRRELCGAAAHAPRTVQEVAAAWGFWHLSQFAHDYRKLFGRTPSESLRMRRAA